MDCIFCKIVEGKIPSQTVYKDDEIIAFRDINPQTLVHILVIPRRHITNLTEVTEADTPLIARMVNVANKLAKREGISEKGYRIVINSGDEGGQVVQHLHMHLLGGRALGGKICY